MTYTVEVTDSRGQRQQAIAVVTIREKSGEIQPPVLPGFKPAEPPPPELSAQGPLAQALADLWDKARKAKVGSIASLTVRLFEAGATWKVHQAMATLQEADVTCHFEVGIEADGIVQFEVCMIVESTSVWRLEIWQVTSPATPRLKAPEHVATIQGPGLRIAENRLLKRLAREKIVLGSLKPGVCCFVCWRP